MGSKRMMSAKRAIGMVAVAGLCFVLVEGLASTAIAVFQALHQPVSEPSRYDASLGWVGTPNAFIPDMYGRGEYVRMNGRGFRDQAETGATAAGGKVRIICSGDSFTFGEGVRNDHAWCHRLSELEGRFETVNLALPGYGVDQMYLRYLAQGVHLQHSIHLLAFVEGDFQRMAAPSLHGYGKPTLAIDERSGEVIPRDVPVPRFRWWLARVIERAGLRTVELSRRIRRRVGRAPPGVEATIAATGPIAARTLQSIQELADARGVFVVFVLLPTQLDLATDLPWREWALATMSRLGSAFIDLAAPLRDVPAGQAASFFIPGDGHYSESGNQWVAESVYARLMQLAPVRAFLARP